MKTVVVVEDDVEILALVCEVLEAEGYRVVGLARPEEVWGLPAQTVPQLFLVDIMLPGMGGVELAEALRSDGYPTTPMVAMSASATMLKKAAEAKIFGATLPKPFDLELLISTVGRYTA